MEVNNKKVQAALDCLDFNKQLNEVHVTSDLHCFPIKGDAIQHARGLADKTIDVFTRDNDGVEFDLLDSVKETIKANTIPDPKLAKEKKAGGAKDKPFEKVKKPAAKDPAATYGEDAKKEPAPKMATARVKTVKPATKTATEKPADQQTNTDSQQ